MTRQGTALTELLKSRRDYLADHPHVVEAYDAADEKGKQDKRFLKYRMICGQLQKAFMAARDNQNTRQYIAENNLCHERIKRSKILAGKFELDDMLCERRNAAEDRKESVAEQASSTTPEVTQAQRSKAAEDAAKAEKKRKTAAARAKREAAKAEKMRKNAIKRAKAAAEKCAMPEQAVADEARERRDAIQAEASARDQERERARQEAAKAVAERYAAKRAEAKRQAEQARVQRQAAEQARVQREAERARAQRLAAERAEAQRLEQMCSAFRPDQQTTTVCSAPGGPMVCGEAVVSVQSTAASPVDELRKIQTASARSAYEMAVRLAEARLNVEIQAARLRHDAAVKSARAEYEKKTAALERNPLNVQVSF